MIVAIILLILVYILNLVDYWQTIYAIQLFGVGIEANPIGRFLFENNCAWVVKLIIVPIILIVMGFMVRIDKRMIFGPVLLLIVYIGAVVNNFIVLSQMGVFYV